MKKKLIREKVIDYLTEKGLVEIESKSGKYRTFMKKNDINAYHYFVGKKGAVRVGKCSSKSISITRKIHGLIKGKENEKET